MSINPINNIVLYNYHNKNSHSTKLAHNNISFKSNKIFYENLANELYKEMDFRRNYFVNTRYHCISGYIEALKYFNVTKFIKLGGESAVFEFNNGRQVLKLSSEQYAPFVPKYHAKEYERGTFALSKTMSANNANYKSIYINKIYYIIQEKGTPCVNSKQYDDIVEEAEKDGYFLCDIKAGQFATFKDGTKIIDTNIIVKDKNYFLNRDLLACSKMMTNEVTKPYMQLHQVLKNHFPNTTSDLILNFLKTIEQQIKNGKPLIEILKDANLLKSGRLGETQQ